MSPILASKERKHGCTSAPPTSGEFEFQTFCSFAPPTGVFRDNIQAFLGEMAENPTKTGQNRLVWGAPLVHDTGKVIPLYIIEGQHPFCNHCMHSGWDYHLVSLPSYHFVIPADDDWNKPLADDFDGVQGHIFHGLVHCNGLGHLLIINGAAGGSKHLRGREIMDLWDRICTSLRTVKITVEDLSRKWSVELRLLFGAAYGHSWFAKWGYTFCPYSSGVTEAINRLYLWNLKDLESFTGEGYQEINRIIDLYKGMSESWLVTLGALLTYMLTIRFQASALVNEKNDAASSSSASKSSAGTVQEKSQEVRSLEAAIEDGKWSKESVGAAAGYIIEALVRVGAIGAGCRGVSRKDLKFAVQAIVTDNSLLDYALKTVNNVLINKYIIRRTKNPVTRVFHYYLEDIEAAESNREVPADPPLPPNQLPDGQVYRDIVNLYYSLLLGHPDLKEASHTVLSSTRFVKEWC